MLQHILAHYKIILAVLLVLSVVILSGATKQALSIVPTKAVMNSPLPSIKAESKPIVIDISGAVNHPGVYSFVLGSRIEQAIKAAGGLSTKSDRAYIEKNLNLSQKLTDGMKLYIPSQQERTEDIALVSTPATLVNINTASVADLDKLPSVTPTMAQKMVDKRPYLIPDDLVTKKVITKTIFEKIKKLITAM